MSTATTNCTSETWRRTQLFPHRMTGACDDRRDRQALQQTGRRHLMGDEGYRATARLANGTWQLGITKLDDVEPVFSKSLGRAEAQVRSVLSRHGVADAESVPVHLDIELPAEVTAELDLAAKLRGEAAAATSAAAAASRSAARLLADQGLTLRDIGAALGISFQRAQQLLQTPTAGSGTTPPDS